MKIFFVDVETFYDQDYSLRKLTPVEYVLDPRFECIGWAVAGIDGPARWLTPEQFATFLGRCQGEEVAFVSHNALFDMTVLAWRFDFVPTLMIDTLGMARAMLASQLKSLSLANVATHLGLGVKGDTVHKVVGMGAAAIKAAGIYEEYASYSCMDTELCRGIFTKLMSDGFPREELVVMDMVLRCAVRPQFQLDTTKLAEHLHITREGKRTLLERCGLPDRDALMSNEKFAEALRRLGVEPPMKTSLTTGKETYAFAKTDPDFIELDEHENPDVQALVAARLGLKTTLEETRTERLARIANLRWPQGERWMPIPLRYSGAHTHRLSGDWKINMQNLPRGGALRKALVAPKGRVVVAADASQVEARISAWFCGEHTLVRQFDRGEDVYSSFASKLFERTITKENKLERFIGKTCLAEGTIVVTSTGLIPIEQVTKDHLLWDGKEWVCHHGLVFNGLKEALPLSGLWLTPDHLVLCGTQWKDAQSVQADARTHSLALETGAESWSSLATSKVFEEGLRHFLSDVTVDAQSTRWTATTSKISNLLAALPVPIRRLFGSATGNTRTPCPTTDTAHDFSTGWLRPSRAAIPRAVGFSLTMAGGVFKYIKSGATTALRSCVMFSPFQVGTFPILRWTGSTSMAGISRATFGSSVVLKTCATSARLQTSKSEFVNLKRVCRVYDLANAGPRHRFTVMTDAGPLVVHNCILGLGYGLGWEKFMRTVKIQSRAQIGKVIDLSPEEAKRIVDTYRTTYPAIPAMWRRLNGLLPDMTRRDCQVLINPVVVAYQKIVLPNGLTLSYHGLHNTDDGWSYTFGGKPKRAYGGKLLENIVQSLARVLIMQAATRCRTIFSRLGDHTLDLAMQVHDELVYVPNEDIANVVKATVLEEMSRRPAWGHDLPLAAEADIGPTYGDAK